MLKMLKKNFFLHKYTCKKINLFIIIARHLPAAAMFSFRMAEVGHLNSRCLNGLKSRVCTVLGSQWGDEGKGKLVGMLAD